MHTTSCKYRVHCSYNRSPCEIRHIDTKSWRNTVPVTDVIIVDSVASVVITSSDTGGVSSDGDPSSNRATHTTSVPLYSRVAGIVSVFTRVPLSLVEPVVISGNCPTHDPFILQLMKASLDK